VKVLIHAQHLSGVGHAVRAHELARALGAAHAVVLTDGGRAVPRPPAHGSIERLSLPRLVRGAGGLAPLDAGGGLAEVLAERSVRLRAEAARFAPDVLLVEHYPFSKWELEAEILAAVEAVRAANPAALVVCSLRDVCPKTRHEPGVAWAARVAAALRQHYDALLVHADPRFTRLQEHFPEGAALELPVFHTGFVAEQPRDSRPPTPGGFAVLSVGGGGAGSADFALRCIEAWRRLHAARATGGRSLVIFAGLAWSRDEHAAVRAAAADGPFRLEPFGPDFLAWLSAADLSISRAGYNTCTNLLATGCPALLVPDSGMSDQAFRAARLCELGLAEIAAPDASAEPLAHAMTRALRRPRSRPFLDLDGARRSRALLETLVAAGPDLRALARARGPLRAIEPLTRRPSPRSTRAACKLAFADGSRSKGRRLRDPERARRVERLLAAAGDGFPRVLARRGDALLLEWIDGTPLDALPVVPADVLRGAGELLGALHRLDADGWSDGPLPGPADAFARLERDLAALASAQALDAERVRRVLESAAAQRPRRASVGFVHRDFCAENLALAAPGGLVSIDNASLDLGPHDLDLARTWVRWPLSREERAHFAGGYEKHRGLDDFLAHFAFWASCSLVHTAAKRLRLRAPDAREPLERLERVLAAGDGARAFWELR
jgi:predicted glycosyltransferase